jgi:hypothetical protein
MSLLSLCVARYLFFHLLQVPLSRNRPPILLISLSQRPNLPLSSQNFFLLQDRAFNMSRILHSTCIVRTYMSTNIWPETSARL